jgi:hypothetical protein
MHKPKPNRKQQVVDKIAYATHRHQELMSELFSAKNEDRDPTYLVHAAADVLAAARECFDYLGQDIIECWIIPNTANPKLLKAYADGKLKSYFPFYTSQNPSLNRSTNGRPPSPVWRPNPSLNRSTNGRPPGPVWRYAVHFRQPGPGVLPLAPG